MTPEQEDALVESCFKPDSHEYALAFNRVTDHGLIRLAIRAAYAQGREDAAEVCEEQPSLTVAVISETATGGFLLGCAACAAAIRRGE